MNYFLLSASALTIVLGLIHSALGEKLIFIKLRRNKLSGALAIPVLSSQQIGILWATWHLAS